MLKFDKCIPVTWESQYILSKSTVSCKQWTKENPQTCMWTGMNIYFLAHVNLQVMFIDDVHHYRNLLSDGHSVNSRTSSYQETERKNHATFWVGKTCTWIMMMLEHVVRVNNMNLHTKLHVKWDNISNGYCREVNDQSEPRTTWKLHKCVINVEQWLWHILCKLSGQLESISFFNTK